MSLPDALAVTVRVVEALGHLGIRYVIGGSLASSIRGTPRATMDVDIVAEISVEHAEGLAHALGPDFYADAHAIRDALRRGHSFNVLHMPTGFKVDLFPRGSRPFDHTEFERRQEAEIATDPPVRLAVKTAEDTLLSKLEWYRKRREVSEQQWRDVLGIIQTQRARLDRSYLERWARELRVEDLLAGAFDAVERGRGRE